jgi:hypothetical protein
MTEKLCKPMGLGSQAASAAMVLDPPGFITLAPELWQGYPLLAIAAAASYGLLLRRPLMLREAGVSLACWMIVMGLRGYVVLRQRVAGLDLIAWGMGFFVLAAAISMRKAGARPRDVAWKPPQNEV